MVRRTTIHDRPFRSFSCLPLDGRKFSMKKFLSLEQHKKHNLLGTAFGRSIHEKAVSRKEAWSMKARNPKYRATLAEPAVAPQKQRCACN